MPFRALGEALSPEELAVLGRAFDGVCAELKLDRQRGDQSQREHIAQLRLKFASQGIFHEATLQTAVIAELCSPRPLRVSSKRGRSIEAVAHDARASCWLCRSADAIMLIQTKRSSRYFSASI